VRASGWFLISARRRSNSTPSPMHNVQLRRSLQLYAYYMGIIYPPLIVICFWCAPAEAITTSHFCVVLNAVLIDAVIGEICSLSKIEKNRQKRQLNLKGIIVSSIITRNAFNAKGSAIKGVTAKSSICSRSSNFTSFARPLYVRTLSALSFLRFPPKRDLSLTKWIFFPLLF
jgi:hypothetical protein